MALPILVGLALGAVLYQMIRRPVLRRLSLRETTRRRGESLLVVAGSLLGTAIIAGSFIVGDTLDSSIRATATTQLGPIDEVVVTPDAATRDSVFVTLQDADIQGIDGLLTLISAQASAATSGPAPLSEPSARLLELDFEEAGAFGSDPGLTGLEGSTPRRGRTAITEDLALSLEVDDGDEITVSLYGQDETLEVDRVLPRLGLAGYWTGFESVSPNAFVAPGTIERLLESGGQTQVPAAYSVLISNDGGVEEGAALTAAVVPRVEDALANDALTVEPVKKDKLDSAKEQGDEFAEFFLAIGSFAIMAGILLLVQIFVMLSEERKSQLGMLRAVGMRRSDLIRSFYMQGGLFAVPAGVAGTILGIGVGWAIVKVAAPIFGGFGDFSLELR
ncbi:MAG: FtsX-like permease family protein, partial [Actinobacteria bacterium]|nr:FtsX-like permease family protein [Actinomycetota bacterium]